MKNILSGFRSATSMLAYASLASALLADTPSSSENITTSDAANTNNVAVTTKSASSLANSQDTNNINASLFVTRIGVLPVGNESYFIRPFLDLEVSYKNTTVSAIAYNASPFIPSYLAAATLGHAFQWGTVSFGEFDFSLFGAQSTLLGADRMTIPSPILAYRYVGNIGGLGSQVNMKLGSGDASFSVTDGNINTLPKSAPTALGVINIRAEDTYQFGDFKVKALGIESTGGALPYQHSARASQTLGGSVSYARTFGHVDLSFGVEAAYNTRQKCMMNSVAEATYHATKRLSFDLTACALTRSGKTDDLSVQGLCNYRFTKDMSLMAGGGVESPNNPFFVLGFNYKFGCSPH